jgi:hypothetical protein
MITDRQLQTIYQWFVVPSPSTHAKQSLEYVEQLIREIDRQRIALADLREENQLLTREIEHYIKIINRGINEQ